MTVFDDAYEITDPKHPEWLERIEDQLENE